MADRDQYELQCFLTKLWGLRNAGKSACLTVECRDMELSINLQLNLPRPTMGQICLKMAKTTKSEDWFKIAITPSILVQLRSGFLQAS